MNEFRSASPQVTAFPPPTVRTLDRIARSAVPAFADFTLIYGLEGRALRCVGFAHRTREGDRLLRRLKNVYRITRDDADSTVAQVVRRGTPSVRASIHQEPRLPAATAGSFASIAELHLRLGVRSAIVVPLRGRRRIIGAMVFSQAGSGRTFARGDVAAAERIAARAAAALDALPSPEPRPWTPVTRGRTRLVRNAHS